MPTGRAFAIRDFLERIVQSGIVRINARAMAFVMRATVVALKAFSLLIVLSAIVQIIVTTMAIAPMVHVFVVPDFQATIAPTRPAHLTVLEGVSAKRGCAIVTGASRGSIVQRRRA